MKTNALYRLLRNFSIDNGLVKNIRVRIIDVGARLITVRRMTGFLNPTEDILIPRITFTHVLPSGHTLHRRQFPLAPAYATTFNSCQGLTLDKVGVDLTVPVFSHGQLYTALSRVRNRQSIKVLLPHEDTTTTNVTYSEILR
jgi:ATP-dependent exoDNAse (exonuclease V) alpha subunit